MVHKEPSKRMEHKIGKPLHDKPKLRKPENEILATPRHKKSIKRGAIAPVLESLIVEPVSVEISKEVHKLAVVEIQETKENMEIMETVNFINGENILSLRFSRLHNRSFRIQVFLNAENEIRPVTYTGARTAYAFWNLLKGALKK